MSPHAQDTFQTWAGIFDEAPREFLAYLDDPAFQKAETTFCIWRRKDDQHWRQGDVEEPEEGEWSARLLDHVFLDAASYLDWARDYYNRKELPESVIRDVFDSCHADRATVLTLNPKADLEMVGRELELMGVILT